MFLCSVELIGKEKTSLRLFEILFPFRKVTNSESELTSFELFLKYAGIE